MPPSIRKTIEFAPLVAFFAAWIFYDMMIATKVITVLTLVGIAVTYYYEKKIPPMSLFTAGVLLLFASMTLFTGNTNFIKIKPTILYLLLAMILLIGLAKDKIFLKTILDQKLNLSDKDWVIFSKRWAYFFVFLALLNEFVWRNFSEGFWVTFKVFGIIVMFIIFAYTQRDFFTKGLKK